MSKLKLNSKERQNHERDALGVRCRELIPCEKECLRGRIVSWNAVEKSGKKRAPEKEKKYEFFFPRQPMQQAWLLPVTSLLINCQFVVIVKFYISYFFLMSNKFE